MTGPILKFVGPNGAVQLFGVKLVGVNGENGRKFLFSLVFIALIWFLAWILGKAAGTLLRKRSQQAAF